MCWAISCLFSRFVSFSVWFSQLLRSSRNIQTNFRCYRMEKETKFSLSGRDVPLKGHLLPEIYIFFAPPELYLIMQDSSGFICPRFGNISLWLLQQVSGILFVVVEKKRRRNYKDFCMRSIYKAAPVKTLSKAHGDSVLWGFCCWNVIFHCGENLGFRLVWVVLGQRWRSAAATAFDGVQVKALRTPKAKRFLWYPKIICWFSALKAT